MEFRVEDAGSASENSSPSGLALRLLGPLRLEVSGTPAALPPSRKVRALLAYLALHQRPVSRSHLCELLWDLPSDPRGELRWALSRLRNALQGVERARVSTTGDTVALQLPPACVDALEVTQALHAGIATLPLDRLKVLAQLLRSGDLLEGLELPRSPVFMGWLVSERRRFRAWHAAVLAQCVRLLPLLDDEQLPMLDRWLAVAPFDREAHERMLQALAARGRLREGVEHLATAARRYEAEGQDWGPLAHTWRTAKARQAERILPSGTLSASGGQASAASPPAPSGVAARASLAVLPFADRTPGAALRGGLADGMAHDVITRLAKLRSMFVIAEGTMFSLSERQVGGDGAARQLAVDYLASGALRRTVGAQLHVAVQLTETCSSKVIWAQEFSVRLDDTFAVVDEICDRIVTAIAQQVEISERNRAVLKNPSSLTSWEAHHRGLWHAMRFARDDNEQARHFFQTAVRLDPTFGRPLAGLSFTHFQDAFQGWSDPDAAIELAYRTAADALMADDSDPACHWAYGRALWLKRRSHDAVRELHTAVDLSPNFAHAHYTIAFVQSQDGDPELAIAASQHAQALSPMDPLLFGMLASQALALVRLGRFEEAAQAGVRAAARPNAHVHIQAIALLCLVLSGRIVEAHELAAMVRRSHPDYSIRNFVHAFRVGPELEALLLTAARDVLP